MRALSTLTQKHARNKLIQDTVRGSEKCGHFVVILGAPVLNKGSEIKILK